MSEPKQTPPDSAVSNQRQSKDAALKSTLNYRVRAFMLPGLKRWILVIIFGIAFMIIGVFLLLGFHPVYETGRFLHELMSNAADVLPHRVSGIIVITGGALFVCVAVAKVTQSVLGAYLPADRESIPDVLYRRRHLDRGPRIVVIGGGTGLANLLKGLKNFTNNITAIVTVGDDGGSSGRLRQEMGVLPPGDIRNCITALADEEKLVTELFRYRFETGEGLEGHSFGNLFLTALCAITGNDMIEAVRVASRVLNSCGQVLPATLDNINLIAELDDGRVIKGESHITEAHGRIRRLTCDPFAPKATPEAIDAILNAELIVLGPGSLYTSIVPNLLIHGIPDAIRRARAPKIYVCNVMTQEGETIDYSVADHVDALFLHSGTTSNRGQGRLVHAVLINDQVPVAPPPNTRIKPVRFDPERLRELSVAPVKRALLSPSLTGHHDPYRLAKYIMLWFYRRKRYKAADRKPPKPPARAASFMSFALIAAVCEQLIKVTRV